jgi:uroporphyrinogen decarboxylase
MDYSGTEEANRKLMRHLGVGRLEEAFKVLRIDRPLVVGPEYRGPRLPPGTDQFGCRTEHIQYGTGDATGFYEECVFHPLARFESVEEIRRNYRWPSADWGDYSGLPRRVEGTEHLPLRGGGSEPFLTYKDLRGDEQAYVDLVEHPDIVEYCLDILFELAYQNTLRIYESIPGRILVTAVAEDLGSEQGLLISAPHINRFLIPRMRRIIDLAHEAGAFVLHHSDGAIRGILPDMIAAGIDILDPVQWRCAGMERRGLKRDFGARLVFHGGCDNQRTLAFGTTEDVRREVEENIQTLGAGGGYILGPCHNIQAVSPAENIVAMYRAGYEYGGGVA